MATLAFKAADDAILLVGGHGSHLGQSIYLREVLGREEGAPPPVDLSVEKRNGDFIRDLINRGQVSAVHDISDGGLGLAVIEMAMASTLGASLGALTHEQLFGEDQARYVITCKASEAAKIITQAHVAGVHAIRIGTVTAEPAFAIENGPAIPVETLRTAHESWFPAYMAGEL
jgi:phosphoribosylformylglycinamidine synthase